MRTDTHPNHNDFDVQDETILHSTRAPELIFLAAMRAWLRPYCESTRRRLETRDVLFAAAIDDEGVEAFERLMRGILKLHGRGFDSRCRCCSQLAADEGALLNTVALLQRGCYAEAVEWYAERLPLESAERIVCQAWHVAGAFADAGLIIAVSERDVVYMQ